MGVRPRASGLDWFGWLTLFSALGCGSETEELGLRRFQRLVLFAKGPFWVEFWLQNEFGLKPRSGEAKPTLGYPSLGVSLDGVKFEGGMRLSFFGAPGPRRWCPWALTETSSPV